MSVVRDSSYRVDLHTSSDRQNRPASSGGPRPAEVLARQFPARPLATSWPQTRQPREQVLGRLLSPPFAPGTAGSVAYRRRALNGIFDWLSDMAGASWQQRWINSAGEAAGNVAWRDVVVTHLDTGGYDYPDSGYPHLGGAVRAMICADVLRPSLSWLTMPATVRYLAAEMARSRDPDGFDQLQASFDADRSPSAMKTGPLTALAVRYRIAAIMAAKGGMVHDITVGDCLELIGVIGIAGADGNRRRNSLHFYQVLHTLGVFPEGAPPTLRMLSTTGRLSVEQMIERHNIACIPVRDLLIDYLREREIRLDHSSLKNLSYHLAGRFWKDLETHHPGIDTLKLPPKVAAAWKQRTIARGGVGLNCLTTVRAFYLDLAHWALEEPARWARWVVPCPIRREEASHRKEAKRRKSRMDQRTRERLPILPVLVAATDRERKRSARRLEAALATAPGELFEIDGEQLRRSVLTRHGGARVWAEDPATGERRDLSLEEHRGFWSWAAVEVLRHTGIRLEELTELSHHSFVQYSLPTTGELVPLLHIVPSKTDTERLLVIDPELADVLSTIVCRIRDVDGTVPLVIAYDRHECSWKPPMPLLFQRRFRHEHRPIPANAIRDLLGWALKASNITDASGQPLVFAPHDLRRIFVTDAIVNGMPPHIAQLICGHTNINTTMGYKAVYPEEAINGHRAFIARRRGLRPGDEYRVPTDEEWDDFLGHFERRKVALGTCGRAFATPCIHEHSCLRCPLLRPDPAQRPRMVEIHDNLLTRIAEAERERWPGEVEGLKVSLAATRHKLAQIDECAADTTIVNLSPPNLSQVTGRNITGKERP
ncbi:MAG: site-specific integrase [Dehalococcoidia bacterium]